MIPVTCITHCDIDGYGAGAIVKRRFPNAECIVTNYGKPIPFWKIQPGATVVVTDFSLTYEEFRNLQSRGNKIIWIDHHKNNYDKLESAGLNTIDGVRRDDMSGAELAWTFFFPEEPMPECIKLIGDFDLWKWRYENTGPFIYGMDLFDVRPGTKSAGMWADLLNNEKFKLDQIIDHGKPISEYIKLRNKTMADELCYRTELDGRQIIVANNKQANSMFFDSVDKTGIDALMLINWFGDFGRFRCSVYSPDDIKEVIDIAQKFSGGGHPKAAGFNAPEWPVRYPEKQEIKTKLEDVIKGYETYESMRESNFTINQCASKTDSIALRAQAFLSVWGDSVPVKCIAINHPYIPVIKSALPYCFDAIHPITGACSEVLVGFVMTNHGHWRVGVSHIDGNRSLDEIYSMVKHTNLAISEDQIFKDGKHNTVWYYSDNLPVQLQAQIRN